MILQDPHRQTIRDKANDGIAEYHRRSIIEQAKAEMREEEAARCRIGQKEGTNNGDA